MPNVKTVTDDINALKAMISYYDDPDPAIATRIRDLGEEWNIGKSELQTLRDVTAKVDANPDDQMARKEKAFYFNQAYDRIASSRDAENWGKQDQKIADARFQIKNFVDNNPKAAEAYLRSLDYQTRYIDGELEYKKEGEPRYHQLDPSEPEYADLSDIAMDVAEGLTGATIGAASSMIPGGAGLLASSGLQGLNSAAYDAVRQVMANAYNIKKGYSPQDTGESFLTSAALNIPLEGTGRILTNLGGAAKEMGQLGSVLKANAGDIKSAYKKLGLVPTPGVLSADPTLEIIEDAINRGGGTLVPGYSGGIKSFKEKEKLKRDTLDRFANEALEVGSRRIGGVGPQDIESVIPEMRNTLEDAAQAWLNKVSIQKFGVETQELPALIPRIQNTVREKSESLFEAVKDSLPTDETGVIVKRELLDNVQSKHDRAKAIFEELGNVFKRSGFRIEANDKYLLANDVLNAAHPYRADDKAMEWATEYARKITDETNNLDDINAWISGAWNKYREARMVGNGHMMAVSSKTAKLLEDTKQSIFDRLVESADSAGRNPAYIEQLREKLATARRLWKQANDELVGILDRPGSKEIGGSLGAKIDDLKGLSPEEVFKKVYSSGDSEKIAWMRDTYPEQYKKVVLSKMNEIFRKASMSDNFEQTVINQFKSMSDTEKKKIFGENAIENISNLNQLIKAAKDKTDLAKRLYDIQQKVLNAKYVGNGGAEALVGELNRLSLKEKKYLFGDHLRADAFLGNMKDAYLKAVDKIRLAEKVNQIANKISTNQTRSSLDAYTFLKNIKTMSNQDKQLIFGPDYADKIEAMFTIFKYEPRLSNASYSTLNKDIIEGKFVDMNKNAIRRYFLYNRILKAGDKAGSSLNSAGKFFKGQSAKGALFRAGTGAGRALIPDFTGEGQNFDLTEYLLLPKFDSK